ncbi:hypothetical protein WJX79_001282 [Trebouxia sp. C0005]
MGQKSSKAPQVEARYLAPQKLYCYSEVDLRKLRKLIKDRKLAPCFPGVDSESRELEDCPICFLKFPSLNRAVCCHKPICTECFLQVKSLQAGHCPKCPYCKADFSIYFHGPVSSEQKLKHQAEEQQQALAAKRAQQEERRQSQQLLEQRLPAVPLCPAAYESGSHTPSSNQAKVLQQTDDALQQYGDFLPHDLSALAEAFDYNIDLNEVMFMQGLCASLQPPDQEATATAGIPAAHGGSHHSAAISIPIPAQAACNPQSAQQRTRSSPGLDVDAYQVACSPEDQAIQEAIAIGDAILQRLYQPGQDNVQERTVSAASEAHSSWGINTARDSDVQRDTLLKRMEDQDARLRAMYAAG